MDILNRIQKRLELGKVKAENREFEKKFGKPESSKNIPAMHTGNMRNDKIVKEIKGTATGATIAYEREDGSWIWAGTDHHLVQKDENDRPFISSSKSPLTKEFEAQQALSYPIFNGS